METVEMERQTATPTDTAQLPLRPGDAVLWRRRPDGRPPAASHELLSSKHKSSSLADTARTAASGVEQPHSGCLAMADADLPSLSYGHLGGDSTGPAQRGLQGAGALRSDRAPSAAGTRCAPGEKEVRDPRAGQDSLSFSRGHQAPRTSWLVVSEQRASDIRL
jgi:hypothetical protein